MGNEQKYEIGEVYVPLDFFKAAARRVRKDFTETKTYKVSRKKKRDRVDTLVGGLCALQYLADNKLAGTLCSGEIKCSVHIAKIYNDEFTNMFKMLVKRMPETFSIRVSMKQAMRPTSYGIKYNHNTKWVKLDKESVYYKSVYRFVNVFMKYVKENAKGSIPEEYVEFAENYYKYCIDMDIASSVCKDRHGFTFEEAKKELHSSESFNMSARMKNVMAAFREYEICESFNRTSYNVHMTYGRLYSPFHNIAKDYRVAFRTRKGEKVKELMDIHGAFVKGAFTTAGLVAKEVGNKESAKKLLVAVSKMDDPYTFAIGELDRKKAKKAVLSYLFANKTQIGSREKVYARVLKYSKDIASVLAYTDSFLEFMDKHTEVYYMKQNELRKAMGKFYGDSIILDSMNIKGHTAYFTNGNGKGMNLRRYVNLVVRVHQSITTHYVQTKIDEVYGKDVRDALEYTSQLFEEASKRNIDNEQEASKRLVKGSSLRSYWRKDMHYGNVINTSIVCQIAEGKAMFGKVLPALKKQTKCNKLVTLHDAIYCPESVYTDLNKLQKDVDNAYVLAVIDTFNTNELVRNALKYRVQNKAA